MLADSAVIEDWLLDWKVYKYRPGRAQAAQKIKILWKKRTSVKNVFKKWVDCGWSEDTVPLLCWPHCPTVPPDKAQTHGIEGTYDNNIIGYYIYNVIIWESWRPRTIHSKTYYMYNNYYTTGSHWLGLHAHWVHTHILASDDVLAKFLSTSAAVSRTALVKGLSSSLYYIQQILFFRATSIGIVRYCRVM